MFYVWKRTEDRCAPRWVGCGGHRKKADALAACDARPEPAVVCRNLTRNVIHRNAAAVELGKQTAAARNGA